MAAVVQEQGKDIAEFAKSSQQEQDEDSSMDLHGADPSQVIAEAAAASTAAAAAAGASKNAPHSKTKAEPVAEGGGEPAHLSGAPAPVSSSAAA